MTRSFGALRDLVPRKKEKPERCELCSAIVPSAHPHLIDPTKRQLVCSCDPCSILFSGQENARYKRVPRDIRVLSRFEITDAQWEELLIPIGMAFFFYSTPDNRTVVLYPGPAGVTESLLKLESWSDIVKNNPVLKEMQPDVECLLVNRIQQRREYYLVPIDECYKLTGLIRMNWHGLSGGTEVWAAIHEFFESLRKRNSEPLAEENVIA